MHHAIHRSLIPIAAAIAALGLARAAPANPQTASQSTSDMSSQRTESSRPQRLGTPPQADVKPFESAKLSLTQAIAESQKEMRGKTLDARFEVWQGRPAYIIRTYSANQIWQSRIDANTGQPIGQPTTVSQTELGPQVQRDVTAVNNAQTGLDEAISNAEQKEGGKAIMASVRSTRRGAATYDVSLVRDGRVHTAMIDTSTGQMR
jgi:uncharacterized membrane protein YkoI